MEIPDGFDPNKANLGLLHETVGPVAFSPFGDLLNGNPDGYDFKLVVKEKGGHRLVPLASALTSKLNKDFCGERNGRANGEVVGNRIGCENCAAMFCLFKAILMSRMATVMEAQEKMKKKRVTVQ